MPVSETGVDKFDRKTLLALLEASRVVNEPTDLAMVCQRVTEGAARVLRAEAASLLMLDQTRNELVFQSTVGPVADSLAGTRMPADKGIAGQAIKTGRAVNVGDARENRNFFDQIDDRTEMTTEGLIAAPLIINDEILGVIEVLNPNDRSNFSDQDLKVLQIFANLVASAMRNAKQLDNTQREIVAHRKQSVKKHAIVGESEHFRRALDLCQRVASVNTTVLITGETGTGKEVAARFIHDQSSRSDRPFVAVNCAAISQTLLESELFGHEKGAFTGADKQRQGWFELADGGTLFLDEIGEMAAATQAKLLRVLQEGEFVRVGGSGVVVCDVRVLAATNRNLKDEIEEGNFREDLYYRINIFPIEMPPLRERDSDIPALAKHFLRTVSNNMGIETPQISKSAIDALVVYDWPGNIRELSNVLERCVLLSRGKIEVADLPPDIAGDLAIAQPLAVTEKARPASTDNSGRDNVSADQPTSLVELEKNMIIRALETADWNCSQAARALDISRDKLRYRMKKYKIKLP